MIKEIYSRDIDAPKYNDDVIEVTDQLQQLILKIENCLFTRQGDVLGSPNMGCNLDDLVFSLVLNEPVNKISPLHYEYLQQSKIYFYLKFLYF